MNNPIALIPARGNSKRITKKNIKPFPFGGPPLIAYTISAAIQSGLFGENIYVSSDDSETLSIAREYGAKCILRPKEYAADNSVDYDWVRHALDEIFLVENWKPEIFFLLRPTNPLRTADTIKRAWEKFKRVPNADSLRAVELIKQHPGKMWSQCGNLMYPYNYSAFSNGGWIHDYTGLQSYDRGTQFINEKVFVQNGSMHICKTGVLPIYHNITGQNIVPFFTEGREGYDLNSPDDWMLLEVLYHNGLITLPEVQK